MTERLEKIFSAIPCGEVFADIGCDHGYIAKAMLDSGKCKKVIVSDISEKCLQKARDLLADYIEKGKAISVVSDGFEKVKGADIALIAGMGGEEICSILSKEKSLPETLVLQPMKNPEKVRNLLLELKYKFIMDSVFKSSGKFYDLLVLVKGEDFLTEEEIEFGRDNLKGNNQDFKDRLLIEISRINEYLNREISEKTKVQLSTKLEKYKKYV